MFLTALLLPVLRAAVLGNNCRNSHQLLPVPVKGVSSQLAGEDHLPLLLQHLILCPEDNIIQQTLFYLLLYKM